MILFDLLSVLFAILLDSCKVSLIVWKSAIYFKLNYYYQSACGAYYHYVSTWAVWATSHHISHELICQCTSSLENPNLPHSHWRRRHTFQQCSWKVNRVDEAAAVKTDGNEPKCSCSSRIREAHSMPCRTSTSWVFWSGAMRANTVALSASCSAPMWEEKCHSTTEARKAKQRVNVQKQESTFCISWGKCSVITAKALPFRAKWYISSSTRICAVWGR